MEKNVQLLTLQKNVKRCAKKSAAKMQYSFLSRNFLQNRFKN